MTDLKIKFEKVSGDLQANMAKVKTAMDNAAVTAANMVASMILEQGKQDIQSSGKFGERWTEGLKVDVEGGSLDNITISMSHDIEYAGIFETGGEIHGNPLLWIPFSGTDAEGISPKEYGDLVSMRGAKMPLLLARIDRKPRYFGISSVSIPQKWHLRDIQLSAMNNFKTYFQKELTKSLGHG